MRFLQKYWLEIITAAIATYLLFVNLLTFSNVTKIGTDAVSWFLPAKAIINDFGVPYKNYWDTKPNGLILFSTIWLLFAGESITSFRILNFILLAGCVYGMMNIYFKLFPRFFSSIIYLLSLVIFLSPIIQTQFLLIESFGLFFAVIGINILFSEKITYIKKAFFTSVFFVLSGQMKESYALISISILPLLLYTYIKRKTDFKKTMLGIFAGVFFTLSLIFLFIIFNSNFYSYREVFLYITNHNSPSQFTDAIEWPKKEFIYIQYPITIGLIITAFLYIYIKNKIGELNLSSHGKKQLNLNLNIKIQNGTYKYLIVLFYIFGSSIGFMLQNKFGSHYSVQMVFPIMLSISLPLYLVHGGLKKAISRNYNNKILLRLFTVSFYLLAIILLFPKKDYFTKYRYELLNPQFIKYTFSKNNTSDLSVENKINSLTSGDDCILHVYGWGVGTTYFYSNRKPCSRFFLVNLLPEYYYSEYRDSLILNPPSAILYTLIGADLDVERFERNVFNFSRVLKECYVQDSDVRNLYFPKSKEVLSICVKNNS